MGGKKGRNSLKFSLSSSYDEQDYYFDEEMDIQPVSSNCDTEKAKIKNTIIGYCIVLVNLWYLLSVQLELVKQC